MVKIGIGTQADKALMVKAFTDECCSDKSRKPDEDKAIEHIKAIAIRRTSIRELYSLIIGLEESKIKLNDKIYQAFIDIRPTLIKHIPKPSQNLCIRAIISDPYVINLVPQNKFLCQLAMKKNILVYKHIRDEFHTYEYYMQYHKREQKQKEILSEISASKPPPNVSSILRPPFVFGVEIEFISHIPRAELYLLLKEFIDVKLDPINVSTDKWALKKETSNSNMCELSSGILDIEDISDMNDLYKVCNILTALQKFSRIKLDYTCCGLHIHVNARELEYADIIKTVSTYSRLQTTLDKLLVPERIINRFCMPVGNYHINSDMSNFTKLHNTPYTDLQGKKFYAINPYAYFYNSTIEFRQHESTFNFIDIIYWIHIIQSIISTKKLGHSVYFLKSLFNTLEIDKEVERYYTNKYLRIVEMMYNF